MKGDDMDDALRLKIHNQHRKVAGKPPLTALPTPKPMQDVTPASRVGEMQYGAQTSRTGLPRWEDARGPSAVDHQPWNTAAQRAKTNQANGENAADRMGKRRYSGGPYPGGR